MPGPVVIVAVAGAGELPFGDYGLCEGSEFGELAGLEVQVFEE